MFMRRAIELSRVHMEAGEGGPFGAVVVKDGQILGEGWNRVTSTCDPTAHAEVVAIRLACEQLGTFSLKGCEIYTSCEPCPMCLAAIYWARLDRIWYANNQADAAAIQFDDEWLYREVALPIPERSLPAAELMRDEALVVFQAWAVKADKTRY
jgi:tRNA(Arg) A34 adenosine deaminase TadA